MTFFLLKESKESNHFFFPRLAHVASVSAMRLFTGSLGVVRGHEDLLGTPMYIC